jgi:UDP-N-acetylmuramate dehydrogenase
LIKQCGGDVMQFGGAKMSEKHCNFLQNDGTATAADIEKLCDKIANAVKQQTGIELELEIKKVGQE